MSSKQTSVWPWKSVHPLHRQTSSVKILLSGPCCFVRLILSEAKGDRGIVKLSFSLFLTLFYPPWSLYSYIFLPAVLLSFLTILDPPHPYFFCNFGRTCSPYPPFSPSLYSSFPYFFFSLPFLLACSVFKFAWTQGPCLLRKWVKHRHTCAYILYVHTLMPAHTNPLFTTHTYTHSVL